MKPSPILLKSLIRILLSLMTVMPLCGVANGQGSQVPAPTGIVMQRDWDSPVQEGDLIVNELNSLLSSFGSASRNLGPSPELDIYRGVKYLMPLKKALKVLQISMEISSKQMVICPGFPHRTLVSYSFNYLEEKGFNEIHIVADKADQVVAIQLYAARAWSVTDYRGLDPKYRIYDFINSRAKALTTASVGHRTKGGQIVELESKFLDPTANVFRFTRLFLPKPLVELILFRIEKIKARASGN
jgi:hypothetical protein